MMQETTGIDRVEAAIASILDWATEGEPVLNERAPGARPKSQPFTTFMVYWQEGNSFVYNIDHELDDGSIKQMVEDDVYMTARIVCYGKDSMKRCGALRMILKSDVPRIQQLGAILGICDVDDVQAIPESNVDGAIRERAYFQFKFYARVAYLFDVDWFNKVKVEISAPAIDADVVAEIEAPAEGA